MSVNERRDRSFAATDSMSPELRACVHEFGLAIVQACLYAKVTDPRRIRQLVHEIWEGARQPAQRRERLGTLDWLLLQAGAQISAATLMRVLEANSMAIVPMTPSRQMVEASMAEVSGFDIRCTKAEKHRRRLIAAVKAAATHIRPRLLKPIPTAKADDQCHSAQETETLFSEVGPSSASFVGNLIVSP